MSNLRNLIALLCKRRLTGSVHFCPLATSTMAEETTKYITVHFLLSSYQQTNAGGSAQVKSANKSTQRLYLGFEHYKTLGIHRL